MNACGAPEVWCSWCPQAGRARLCRVLDATRRNCVLNRGLRPAQRPRIKGFAWLTSSGVSKVFTDLAAELPGFTDWTKVSRSDVNVSNPYGSCGWLFTAPLTLKRNQTR